MSALLYTEDAVRPPWIANSMRPKELEYADKVLFGKKNAEISGGLTAQPLSKFRQGKHSRSKTTPTQTANMPAGEYTEQSLHRRSKSEVCTVC